MTRRQSKRRPYAWTRCHKWRGVEVEYDCSVDYDYEPGERPIMWGENATPGCDSSVEIQSVTVDATGEEIEGELTDLEREDLKEEIRLSIEDREEDC